MINMKQDEKQGKQSKKTKKFQQEKYDIYNPKELGLTFKPLHKVRND